MLSIAWLIGAFAVMSSTYGGAVFNPTAQVEGAPSFASALMILLVPVLLIWTIASIVWRSQELRILGRALNNVVTHLSEPENIAVDSVVSVSQAIRREITAVGDGIERAIARAGELELLVQNEVSALERSYSRQ